MRRITHIVIHHSASPRYVATETIRKWHEALGWSDIGYHIVIEERGSVVLGRSFNLPGAHVKGHNSNTIGICVTGNNTIRDQKWNESQIESLKSTIEMLQLHYPKAKVLGHRDMPDTATECPGLSIEALLKLG